MAAAALGSLPAAAQPFLHKAHTGFDCKLCHVRAEKGSVELQRPGHKQCEICHADAFQHASKLQICDQCHRTSAPSSATDLLPYPRYEKQRNVLNEFSHARHIDAQARVDGRSGFRADCTFCHHFDAQGILATSPGHPQCAACHNKPQTKPVLSAASTTADCRACHAPEEIENPGPVTARRNIPAHVTSGAWANIKFSHVAHFRARQRYGLDCTSCHRAVLASTNLASLTLPMMLECVACHNNSRSMPAESHLSNCQACHIDRESGAAPVSHARDVRPAFHNESFRVHHSTDAAAPDAKCFVCHTNVAPSVAARNQCVSCHQVMRPASHTARWRDDIHGKYAAIDRQTCATCHTTDYCSRCHNELPASHVPLAVFKGGAHARLAMLNERACLTCHTFQNTCAECHVRKLQ